MALLLEDLEAAAAREHRLNPDGPEEDEVIVLLQKAGRDLLSRQVLHGDDHRRTSYRLLRDHRLYFERLFGALGFELKIDASYQYILLLPGEIATGARRGRLRKDETLVLFALRVIWEEGSRDGSMDDLGRIEADTELLYDRYVALGGNEFPPKTRLKEMLGDWSGRGLVRLGDEDREEEVTPITIMPVICDLVTEGIAREVLTYLEQGGAEGSDVLEHIEAARVAAEAPAAGGEDGGRDNGRQEDLLDV